MTTERITVTDFRDQFSDLVSRVGFHGERVIVTRNGKDRVALVPMEDLRAIEAARAEREAQ